MLCQLSYGGPRCVRPHRCNSVPYPELFSCTARSTLRRVTNMLKLVLLLGLATGYVLGAKAGRERYETIARTASRIKSSQTVQSAAGVLREQAGSAVNRIPTESVLRPVREKLDAARQHLPVPSHNGTSHN